MQPPPVICKFLVLVWVVIGCIYAVALFPSYKGNHKYWFFVWFLELLTQTLVKLDEITPRPQDDAQSCYAHMLDKQMAVIDWSKSAHEIDCLIRGLNPWPIALTTLSGERLKVFAAEKAAGNGEPGTVLEATRKRGLTVACGEGALGLTEIQLVGGKRMKATDFLRGHAIEVGTKLGDE